jgi:plasmid stabilization system protein ParE
MRVVEAIVARVEEISTMPTRGHPVHEHPQPGLREIHAATYRIIYEYNDDTLSVVTIVHMKQNLPRKRLR